MQQDHWFGYECIGPCFHKGSGLVLDLRITREEDDTEPEIDCPVCGESMEFKATWPASKYGYGSRGDVDYARAHSEMIREQEMLREQEMTTEPDSPTEAKTTRGAS